MFGQRLTSPGIIPCFKKVLPIIIKAVRVKFNGKPKNKLIIL